MIGQKNCGRLHIPIFRCMRYESYRLRLYTGKLGTVYLLQVINQLTLPYIISLQRLHIYLLLSLKVYSYLNLNIKQFSMTALQCRNYLLHQTYDLVFYIILRASQMVRDFVFESRVGGFKFDLPRPRSP